MDLKKMPNPITPAAIKIMVVIMFDLTHYANKYSTHTNKYVMH
jgi:hypothetical protein